MERARLQRNPATDLRRFDDGTAIAMDAHSDAFALNQDAADAWAARASWSVPEMAAWLRERGFPTTHADDAAQSFLNQLAGSGLYQAAGQEPPAPTAARLTSYYRIWRTTMRAITNDPVVATMVDRICHQFRVDPTDDAVEFEVRHCADHGWHVEREGRRVCTEDRATSAATELEFQMVDTAVLNERQFIHWHGSGLTRNGQAVLIPGRGRAGKTTLSLAMTEHGFDLMGDDVLFLDPERRLVHPVHRAVLLRDSAQTALRRADLHPPARAQRVGDLVPVNAIRHWQSQPTPLAAVLLVDWDEAGPVGDRRDRPGGSGHGDPALLAQPQAPARRRLATARASAGGGALLSRAAQPGSRRRRARHPRPPGRGIAEYLRRLALRACPTHYPARMASHDAVPRRRLRTGSDSAQPGGTRHARSRNPRRQRC